MIKSWKFIYLSLTIVILSLSLQAKDNTSVIKKLSQKADAILSGTVSEKESSWNSSKTRIYTKATVQVDDLLKGTNTGNSVEIIYPGGEVGDVGELYTHMPTFEKNEEVLVFLKKDNNTNTYIVLNGQEGKLTVIEDSQTGEKITSSNSRITQLKSQIKSYLNEE